MLTWMSPYDVAALYGDTPIAAAMVVCLYSLGKALWSENGSIRPLLLMSMPLWLRSASAQLAENMEEDALFATNRMHTGTALKGLFNVYTGLSGRQAYCESFQYAVSNMGDHAGDVMTRYEQMCRIFAPDTTEEELKQLFRETGVTYLVYHALSEGSDTQLNCFEQVYQSDVISIYKVA